MTPLAGHYRSPSNVACALFTVFAEMLIAVAHAVMAFPVSSEWMPQMTSRLLMEGCLALITIGTMLMR